MSRVMVGLLAVGVLAGFTTGQGGDKPAEPGTLIVVDAAGKEQTLSSWKFVAGTLRLGWLVPPAKDDKKAKAPAGPEALVIRDEMKFGFATGVVALVPLEQVRSVSFDSEKGTMAIRVATGGKAEEDVTLTGSTAYKGINKVTLEAEVKKGGGVAELKYQGGVPRGGIRGIRFPAPKAEAPKKGRPAVVVASDGQVKRAYKVSDLTPLYRVGGGEKLAPTLMFKKTLKVDVAKVKQVVATGDEDDTVWRVVMSDGDDSTLTLLSTAQLDGQAATLLGLVGRVPEGYRLFPVRRVVAVHFDTTEEPKEEKKEKKDD